MSRNEKYYFSNPKQYSMPRVSSSHNSYSSVVGKLYTGEEEIKGKIRIPIPSKLKESYEQEKYLLDDNYFLRDYDHKLWYALSQNEIVEVLDIINTITTKTSKGWIEKKGFFKDYQDWLAELLTAMFKLKGINTSNRQDDMFACLFTSQRVLNGVGVNKKFNRDELINQAEEIYFRYKSVMNCSPIITSMCETFIDIGLENIHYEKGELKTKDYSLTKIKKLF